MSPTTPTTSESRRTQYSDDTLSTYSASNTHNYISENKPITGFVAHTTILIQQFLIPFYVSCTFITLYTNDIAQPSIRHSTLSTPAPTLSNIQTMHRLTGSKAHARPNE
eukprot:6176677-Pyramimonas_sp.AAC.3